MPPLEFPSPPQPPDAAIPAAALVQQLSQDELRPADLHAWQVDSSCFIAVNMEETQGIPYVTSVAVLESSDGGATWRWLGSLEGRFTDLFITRAGEVWLWSTWEVEGTLSSIYRLDGALIPAPALDEAVRARGGCCFTQIERAAFADARTGLVQVSGLEAGVEDPAGAEVGWFGTTDGGETWVWLGAEPRGRWRRLLWRESRDGPDLTVCNPSGLRGPG